MSFVNTSLLYTLSTHPLYTHSLTLPSSIQPIHSTHLLNPPSLPLSQVGQPNRHKFTLNIMRVETKFIVHVKNLAKMNAMTNNEGLLDLVFDWYSLSLANIVIAWRYVVHTPYNTSTSTYYTHNTLFQYSHKMFFCLLTD